MLRSVLRPRMNSSAVAPLTTIPAAATAIIVPPATGCGSPRRRNVSTRIAPSAISSSEALASAARIELLLKPYVNRSLGGRAARMLAPQATSRPSTSDKLCPASATSAIEPETIPIVASSTTNPVLRITPNANARPWPGSGAAWWCPWL